MSTLKQHENRAVITDLWPSSHGKGSLSGRLGHLRIFVLPIPAAVSGRGPIAQLIFAESDTTQLKVDEGALS